MATAQSPTTDGVVAPSRGESGARRTAAGLIGNVMEWFDFAVYGDFAPVIGQQFFPGDDEVASLLAAFGVFASGFLARPSGAAFFGHLGDRHGRHLVLKLSVLLMPFAAPRRRMRSRRPGRGDPDRERRLLLDGHGARHDCGPVAHP